LQKKLEKKEVSVILIIEETKHTKGDEKK